MRKTWVYMFILTLILMNIVNILYPKQTSNLDWWGALCDISGYTGIIYLFEFRQKSIEKDMLEFDIDRYYADKFMTSVTLYMLYQFAFTFLVFNWAEPIMYRFIDCRFPNSYKYTILYYFGMLCQFSREMITFQ